MRPRICEICGSGRSRSIYERRFEPLPGALLAGYDVTVCVDCGFCFAQDLPSSAEFDRYYEEQSKYEAHQRDGAPSEYDTRRLPAAAAIVAEWLPDRQSRVLDIGCATGGMLAALRDIGYQRVVGVDPSAACARAAQRYHQIEVHTAPLSRLPEELGKFDLVIFGSVLEHLLELNETVARIRGLLNPGGCVFIEVPDMTRCTLLDDAPFQEFSVEHVNFFSPVSLQNLWRKHGFSTVGMRQTHIRYLGSLVVREIRGMFRVGNDPVPIERDEETEPELRRYVQKSQDRLERIALVIEDLVARQERIVVWGAGTHTQGLLKSTRLGAAKIVAFVDSNARYGGQSLAGAPIVGPDALAAFEEPILISSQQYQDEIKQEISEVRRLPNRVITLY
ncbi:MAG: methyltransferase domain-containing protein [Verrucomicrobia bacterium]|nr:methyltransferase domain-containing protein [Verrucomicrobiota bacterium]